MKALGKTYHRAAKFREDGSVSALCFAAPRAIDLTRSCWTIVDRLVTCPRCRKIMAKALDRASCS